MTVEEFTQLITQQEQCPDTMPVALQALWYDKKGDWHKAHQILPPNPGDRDSDWVHAYLHRKEGDMSNARYWYNRAGRSEFQGDLEREWKQIASDLLAVPR